jgi:hypothetical protein
MSELLPPPHDHLDAVFALARGQRPDTSRAQYGFESRLMARLRERRQPDPASLWATVSWRMIPFLAAGMIALTLWNSQVVAETYETTSLSNLQNPQTADFLSGLN